MNLQRLGIVFIGFLVTLSAAAPQSRIVHGNLASNYQFPWHVSLTITSTNSTSLKYCGASLIGPHYLLTAASCVYNAVNIKADFGSIHFSSPLQTQNTSYYLVHPQFSLSYNLNNIAIVRLNQDVWYSNEKRAILLAGQSQVNNSFVGFSTLISGFGVWQNGTINLSENLRYAQTTVISNEVCQQNFIPQYIRSDTMCTVGFNNTAQSGCYGDTGGPLVTNVGGTWYQVGLVSTIHGAGCIGSNPNLHTRITPYIQWIYQMTSIAVNP